MIDAKDMGRYVEASEWLEELITTKDSAGLPLLILWNKQDLVPEGSLERYSEYLQEVLVLNGMAKRVTRVQVSLTLVDGAKCSGLTIIFD